MKKNHKNLNFLPQQYSQNNKYRINHNYLKEQFNDSENIISQIKKLSQKCDFTLGNEVDKFEKKFAKISNSKFAIGVGSGTDAIILSLLAAGISKGDEIITTPYTFYATVGAIVSIGAIPKFVDVSDDYNINPDYIERAVTKKTKAILPVHWAGLICNMQSISRIAKKYRLHIIEDACHAILAHRKQKRPGYYSIAAAYSMHPLKNLNVWGDGGVVTTNSKKIRDKIMLLRNHGLASRDKCKLFAGNSRLDTIQAIVANNMLKKINSITNSRIKSAKFYDNLLSDIKYIKLPPRLKEAKQVFHLYIIQASKRDKLKKYLNSFGVDAKIHYPTPMHLQPASKIYGYKKGDFPITERFTKNILSLPVHEFITQEDIKFVSNKIRDFYKKK